MAFDDRARERRSDLVDRRSRLVVPEGSHLDVGEPQKMKVLFGAAQCGIGFARRCLRGQHLLLRGDTIGEQAAFAVEGLPRQLGPRASLKVLADGFAELDRIDAREHLPAPHEVADFGEGGLDPTSDPRAHVGEPALVEAFDRGDDVHAATASLMFNEPKDAVSKEHRRYAKLLNFAVLYGVTDFGLANQLGGEFSVSEARALIAQYNERFPKVKAFMEGIVAEARAKGFTTTLKGRRRYFPDIHAQNRNERLYAERQAMNAPLQGTAADMIKLAMIDVAKLGPNAPARMLLQVHDELLFEAPQGAPASAFDSIRAAMERAHPLNVPVVVDGKRGPNWLDMEPMA